VQPADAHAALDRAAAEAGCNELPAAHNAVLARRVLRDGCVRRWLVELCTHWVH